MTIITQHRFTEGSGTTVADSAATPADMTLVPNGATGWVADSGDGYSFSGASNPGYGASSANPAKIDGLAGGKTYTLEAFCTIPATEPNSAGMIYGVWSFGDGNVCAYQNRSGQIWGYFNGFAAFHINSTPVGPCHHYTSYDSNLSTAALRHQHWIDGQPVTAVDEGHPTLNETLVDPTYIGCGSNFDDQYSGVVYFGQLQNIAGTGGEAIAHALRLKADNDADPDAAGANIVAGGLNGATTGASTSSSDTAEPGTLTIPASGNNRIAWVAATYEGNSPSTIVFDVGGANIDMVLAGTAATSGSSGVALYYLLDAALPASAGTYTYSTTVGSGGTVAQSAGCLEGIGAQSAPTNYATASGTGTSLTVTLPTNAAAGSIVIAVLFDDTTTDVAVHGANQIAVGRVNGTTTGNTHRHESSAKYVPASAATTMSWTGLTNSTQKLGVAVEFAANAAAAGASPPPISGARRMVRVNAIYRMSPATAAA